MLDCIIIIERSSIIRKGLASIFAKNKTAHKICAYDSFDAITQSSCTCEHRVIIANPTNLYESVAKTKKAYNIHADTHFIALVYSYIKKDIINSFDETIYIDDSPSSIVNKIEACSKEKTNTIEHPLSKREIEILKELIGGRTNKEAADKLCLSVHTVVTHRKNIMEKTGIKSLSGLAVYAIVNNIMDIQEIK